MKKLKRNSKKLKIPAGSLHRISATEEEEKKLQTTIRRRRKAAALFYSESVTAEKPTRREALR